MPRKDNRPIRIYHYRGNVERFDMTNKRSMRNPWKAGYSVTSDEGFVSYPWRTRRECLDEARRDGVKAVFVRE